MPMVQTMEGTGRKTRGHRAGARALRPLATTMLGALLAGALTAGTTRAQDVAVLTARTDSLLSAMKLVEARATIEEARRQAPRDIDVLWRLSRVWNLLGDQAGDKGGETFYLQARGFADQVITAAPDKAVGYVRRAAANGKIALFRGTLEAADIVKQVRDDCTKALATPGTDAVQLATAHYILGRTHLKLIETPRPLRMPVGLAWATLADALANLRKAVELRGDFIMFRLDLARALVRDEKAAEARAMLEAASALKPQEVGDDERLREVAVLLAQLKGK